jgi:hypothetical protein
MRGLHPNHRVGNQFRRAMPDVRVFISCDPDHDEDLHDLLLEQSHRQSSGFEISARSEATTLTDGWDERVRRKISEADEVIVICGEHTASSVRASAELRVAQEEQKPYFLLWGRRESMCTKPVGSKRDDNMYSWTWEILQDQIVTTLWNDQPREVAERYKRA